MNFYPENTLTNYTTRLHSEISLQGEWEVGLSEIIFPKNWMNVGEDQHITVTMYAIKYPVGHVDYNKEIAEAADEDMIKYSYFVRAHISKGYYKDVGSLVNEMNRELNLSLDYFLTLKSPPSQFKSRPERDGFARFRYDANTNLVSVYAMAQCEVSMTEDLVNMLGFSKDDFPIENQQDIPEILQAPRLAIVDSERQTMFVYCDVVESVPVGDTSAPLLRVVDIDSPFRSIVHKSFDRPRYIALRKMNFQSLEIDIRDSIGRAIPFESGTVIVTLHFRRANSSYLLT
jgi:hypothetical protein